MSENIRYNPAVAKREIIKADMIMPHYNRPMYVHHINYFKDGAIVWYDNADETKCKIYVFKAREKRK